MPALLYVVMTAEMSIKVVSYMAPEGEPDYHLKMTATRYAGHPSQSPRLLGGR
jgi:hypothetical protein